MKLRHRRVEISVAAWRRHSRNAYVPVHVERLWGKVLPRLGEYLALRIPQSIGKRCHNVALAAQRVNETSTEFGRRAFRP
jgi:hypothetical protein